MSEGQISDHAAIIIALISGAVTIIVAVIPNLISHRKTRVKLDENTNKTNAVLHQVQNDHDTNLRDDLDIFKAHVSDALEKIESAQGYLGRSLGEVRKDIKEYGRNAKAHDAAAALAVEALKERDDAIEKELHKWHPPSSE